MWNPAFRVAFGQTVACLVRLENGLAFAAIGYASVRYPIRSDRHQTRQSSGSASTAAVNKCVGRQDEDFEVEPEGPGTGIPNVKQHHFIECDATSSFHLPGTRNSRLHRHKALPMPEAVAFDFIGDRRSWTDQ